VEIAQGERQLTVGGLNFYWVCSVKIQ
jgi:hypothetical protein